MCTFETSERQKSLKTTSFWHSWLPNAFRTTTVYTFSTSQLPKVVQTCCVLYILTWRCFAPRRCALFPHLNFQKWSQPVVICTFWLGTVLRTTTACNFSSLIWPDGPAPATLASLLFDHSEPQTVGKNTVSRDLPAFSRTCIFFLLTLPLLCSSHFLASLLWLFPPLLFHLPILSEVWLLSFLRSRQGRIIPQVDGLMLRCLDTVGDGFKARPPIVGWCLPLMIRFLVVHNH